jgi:hypothetical protein
MGGACSTHGGNETCIQDFVEKREGRRPFEHLGVDCKIILKWVLGKWGRDMWTGFIWLRIGTSRGLLFTW